jgi:hypothetical protein
MVGHQRPRGAGCASPPQNLFEPLQKPIPVSIVQKNPALLDPAEYDVMQRSWRIDA